MGITNKKLKVHTRDIENKTAKY